MKLSPERWMHDGRSLADRLVPRSISVRVIAFTLVLFLASMWSLAVLIGHLMRSDMTRLLGEQQLSTAGVVASDINNQLLQRLNTLEIAASRIDSEIIYDTAKSLENLRERKTLTSLFNGGTFIARLDGTMSASLPDSRSALRRTLNVRTIDYLNRVLDHGETVIGPPVRGALTGMPMVAAAVPILDPQGRPVGMLGGIIDLGLPGFLDRLTGTHYGETGGYVIVDRKTKQVVTATDRRLVLRKLSPETDHPLVDRFMSGESGYGIHTNGIGQELLSAAKSVPAADWYVAVYLPTEEAFAPLRSMQARIVLVTILLSLLGSGATFWFIRRELRSVREASQTMGAMTSGAIPVAPLAVPPQTELGQMTQAFNQLVATLGSREKALRESERIARGIIEASPVPIAVIDRSFNITFLNAAFTSATGYTAGDLPNMGRWFKLAYPDMQYRQWAMGMITRMKMQVETTRVPHVPFEQSVACKDGTTRTFMCSGTVLDDGEDQANLVVLYDITERKRAEAELHGYRNHLEDLVIARTEELARANEEAEQTRRAQIDRMNVEADAKMESRKLEAVGTLAAGIAHDFNNILGSIIGFAELTCDDVAPGSVADANLRQIVGAGFRARDLVARMLAFARKQPAEPVDVNLVDETREALALLRASLPPSIALDFQSTLGQMGREPVIRCDPTQIQQIVMNLCINASHAMDEQGTIAIRLDPAEALGAPHDLRDGVCVRITDRGSGIPADLLGRIFDPFFTTKAPGKGSGLGLSVVYGIVSSLGGRIDVISKTSEVTGTEFRIFLPVSGPVRAEAPAAVSAPAPAARNEPPASRPMPGRPPSPVMNSDPNARLSVAPAAVDA